ncbi:uncharacterized protein LOC126973982 [Leptidea sinapis]|uniref:uncharacterized protein LOC126973982 n=1 Tax=Leptidea sinapis TaxID=189913 RepID=UPI0021C420BF|nr:uncharacterized protein LOC126973982 [Leptidea sinapis]
MQSIQKQNTSRKTSIGLLDTHILYHDKATGPDDMPAELRKILGRKNLSHAPLQQNYHRWDASDMADSFLVPFNKNKGDIRLCGNYRAIKIISHTLKIWERVISRWLHLMTKVTEKQDLHNIMVFIDLEKAFDRIPRDYIWQSLRAQNVPEWLVQLPITLQLSDEPYNSYRPTEKAPVEHLVHDIALISEDVKELQTTLVQWHSDLGNAGLRAQHKPPEHPTQESRVLISWLYPDERRHHRA